MSVNSMFLKSSQHSSFIFAVVILFVSVHGVKCSNDSDKRIFLCGDTVVSNKTRCFQCLTIRECFRIHNRCDKILNKLWCDFSENIASSNISLTDCTNVTKTAYREYCPVDNEQATDSGNPVSGVTTTPNNTARKRRGVPSDCTYLNFTVKMLDTNRTCSGLAEVPFRNNITLLCECLQRSLAATKPPLSGPGSTTEPNTSRDESKSSSPPSVSTTKSSTSGNELTSPSPQAQSNWTTKVVGGVLTGVAAIVIAIVLFICLFYQRKRETEPVYEDEPQLTRAYTIYDQPFRSPSYEYPQFQNGTYWGEEEEYSYAYSHTLNRSYKTTEQHYENVEEMDDHDYENIDSPNAVVNHMDSESHPPVQQDSFLDEEGYLASPPGQFDSEHEINPEAETIQREMNLDSIEPEDDSLPVSYVAVL